MQTMPARVVLADPPPLTPPALATFPFAVRPFPFAILRDAAGLTTKTSPRAQLARPSADSRVE